MESLNFKTNEDELLLLAHVCEWGIDWGYTHESWEDLIERLKDHAKELLKEKDYYFDFYYEKWAGEEKDFLKNFEDNIDWGSVKNRTILSSIVEKIAANLDQE